METSFLPLFLISILAFLVPIITSWFSNKIKITIPIVVGEIICGIIIGKSFLGIISNTSSIPWLDFLYLFGFTYLMFLSGLEVDINMLLNNQPKRISKKQTLKQPSNFVLGSFHFLITLILSCGVAFILKQHGYINDLVMMTLILSTTSVGIVVPVLKEKLMIKTDLGQTILLSALIADFLTMILITVFVAMNVSAKSTFNVLIIFFVLALIVLFYRLHISKTFDYVIAPLLMLKNLFNGMAHSTSQIKVRGAIALMVLFIAASEILGFEVILGAFMAGILTTLILGEEKTDQLEMKLDAIGYGFFIPIFFISVGINLDLHVFFASKGVWFLLIFLLVWSFLIKLLPSLIFRLKFSLEDSLSAGVLLSSRLSLIIAASTIALREGFITEQVNATVIIIAVCSCIIAPVLFNKMQPSVENKSEN